MASFAFRPLRTSMSIRRAILHRNWAKIVPEPAKLFICTWLQRYFAHRTLCTRIQNMPTVDKHTTYYAIRPLMPLAVQFYQNCCLNQLSYLPCLQPFQLHLQNILEQLQNLQQTHFTITEMSQHGLCDIWQIHYCFTLVHEHPVQKRT